MSFLAPFMLLGLLGAAVPIWIHLRGRRRAPIVRFAAMDFLLGSNKRVARRLRVREIVLLAMRVGACLVFALALAKPLTSCRATGPVVQRGPQAVALVIDDSFTMGYRSGGETLLARAKERARRTLAQLGPEADVVVLFTSEGSDTPLELSRDHLRLDTMIREARPRSRPGDTTGALRRAWALLRASPQQQRVIYLYSALPAASFPAGEPPWPAGAGPELYVDDVSGGATLANVAVTAVRAEKEPGLGGRGVRVVAELANFGPEPVKELPVTLRIGGRPVARGLVSIGPGEGARKTFSVPLPGDARAADADVEIEGDALAADDKRFLRVTLRHEVRVLVVDGDPRTVRHDDETYYLETALRPGDRADSALAVATATPDELDTIRIADYDVIFLCNVKALDAQKVAILRAWVERGGGLWVSVGDNVSPEAYAASMLPLLPQPLASAREVAPGGEAGRPSDRVEHVAAKLEGNHPILAPFGAKGLQALRAARFSRYFLLGPQASGDGRRVLMRFESGAPALVEARAGKGRLLLFTSTIDRDWTDLPIHQAYLPLVQQAARYLAREPSHDDVTEVLVGHARDLPVAPEDTRVEITGPTGGGAGTRKVVFSGDRLRGRQTVTFTETTEPGIYHVAAATGGDALRPRPAADFVVNLDPRGSDVRRVDPAAMPSGGPTAGAGAPAQAPKRRVELWHGLAAALLVLLLAEGALARR
jgi:hypothetical protein